jgi:flagellar protein FlaG
MQLKSLINGDQPAGGQIAARRLVPSSSRPEAASVVPAPEPAFGAQVLPDHDAVVLEQARKQANAALVQKGSELTFEFADDVDRVVVRLVDTRTREVIRQFPTEEMLQIARALKQEPAAGALLRADA